MTTISTNAMHWIEIFYGVLVSPAKTFAYITSQSRAGISNLTGACIVVFLVFMADAIRETNINRVQSVLFNIPMSIFFGITFWLVLFSSIALIATCFNAPKQNIKASLVAIGWSFVPWLFMGPVSCFKGAMGPAHILLALIPYIWMVSLQLLAINESYQLKGWQTLSLVFVVPVLFSLVNFMFIMQILGATVGALLS
jgi:VanZ family protein